MVPEIKYLGVSSLEQLILLAKNSIAKKANMMQFDTMPDPVKYIGKVVQYVGISDISFTRSHFYYSNGIKWTEEEISGEQTTQIEITTVLPPWANADPQVLYIVKDQTISKMTLYVKNPVNADSWFTIETPGGFAIVAVLPQWGDADPNTIYFKADGNTLTGYIKKTGTMGAWYTLGGGSAEVVVDTILSPSSTNPVQNKVIYAAIQDVLAQVSSIYHYKGSCLTAELPVSDNQTGDVWNLEDAGIYGPAGTNVAWTGTTWDALSGDQVPDPVPTQDSDHSVQSGGVYDALLTKEDVANKVTTIDGSSTDDQYPSAKAVYDAMEDLEPIPPGFIQNVDTTLTPVEDGKMMRISKTAFDSLAQRDPDTFYYVPEEHDLLDAKPTCEDIAGDPVKHQKIVECTQAEYDSLAVKDPDTYYMIKDDASTGTIFARKPAWSQAVTTDLSHSFPSYTVPDDGMIVGIMFTGGTTSTGTSVEVNGVEIARNKPNDSDHMASVQCQVNKGDIVTLTATESSTGSTIKFVPFEDSLVDPVEVTPELIRNMNTPDWANAVDIGTAIGTAAGYTCPKRGILVCTGHVATENVFGILRVNNINVGYDYYSSGNSWSMNVNCSVNSGDVVKHLNYPNLSPAAVYAPNNTDARFSYKFVPYKAQ